MSVEYDKKGVRIGLLAAETPPPQRKSGNYERRDAFTAALRLAQAKRNTWFLIGEFSARSSAGSYRTSLRRQYDGFEFAARPGRESGSRLYARYVGAKR